MLSHAIAKRAEVTNLSAENQVSKLSISEEDNEEHDGKTSNIFGALKMIATISILYLLLSMSSNETVNARLLSSMMTQNRNQ